MKKSGKCILPKSIKKNKGIRIFLGMIKEVFNFVSSVNGFPNLLKKLA